MKEKHLRIRIQQCLILAEASNCPRRKFGAMLLDPVRNVVLMDGYNGGPRGGGDLCGGDVCDRDGLTSDQVSVKFFGDDEPDLESADFYVEVKRGGEVATFSGYTKQEAEKFAENLVKNNPPIQSGTHIEIGCVHAEMNVICNCAYNGVRTAGSWLIVTGEPCQVCSKLIHHAGIAKVYAVGGGYMGANGVEYLRKHGVEVVFVEGPQDPRLGDEFKTPQIGAGPNEDDANEYE